MTKTSFGTTFAYMKESFLFLIVTMPEINSIQYFLEKKSSGILAAIQTAQEQKLNVIANNLSNADTPGFKNNSIRFKEIIHQNLEGEKISIIGIDKIVCDFLQGGFKTTNIKTHFALNGSGFFKIKTPSGTAYTRNGQFSVSPDGTLTTSEGYTVLSENDDVIKIPNDKKNIHTNSKGMITADGVTIATLGIADFKNKENLKQKGNSLFITTDTPEPFLGTVEQGSLESSNVSSMNEIVQMTFAQRHFDSAQKIMDEFDKTVKRTINTSAKNS